jgi:hypothetical protein
MSPRDRILLGETRKSTAWALYEEKEFRRTRGLQESRPVIAFTVVAAGRASYER